MAEFIAHTLLWIALLFLGAVGFCLLIDPDHLAD